jgi:membrane-associated phospholipid phosphatase
MGEWLESLVPRGTEVIIWAQSLSNPWLDAIAIFFTSLGYEEFYLLVLPVIYWCIHREIGVSLSYASLLSAWLNSAIKYLFKIPRPSDPRIRVLWPADQPSFPSGHAQNAVVNWGYLAYCFRNPVFWLVAISAIVGIGLSRIVVGVHYPQDVIVGWLIGLVWLLVYVLVKPPVSRWLGQRRSVTQAFLAIGMPLALIFLHPADTAGHYPAPVALTAMGALAGLGIGVVMERAWVRFRVGGVWWRRVLRYLVGRGVVGLLYAVPRLLVPNDLAHELEALVRFVRYALVGWAVSYVAPGLFVRLGLAEREGDRR